MTISTHKRFLPSAFLLGILQIATAFPVSAQFVSNPATVPADRMSEKWWADRHNAVLDQIRSHPDASLVLIGDSITNNYDKADPPDQNFLPTWNEFYAPRKALNLGFSGDTTSHVLWRLNHGELDGIHPKVAVLLIGTNNTARGQTAEQTEIGIDAVVNRIEELLPQTHVLLLGILPSVVSDDKTSRDQAVNHYLATCYGDNPRVTYLDIQSIFEEDGAIHRAIFYDPRLPTPRKPLHPDTMGQRMMAEAIEPTLAELMGDAPRRPLASMTDINTALIPVSRLEQDLYDWFARHHAELDLQKRIHPDVVMIGDSITHFWSGPPEAPVQNGSAAWQKVFSGLSVLNMGFGWDRTQNVLWRLQQGEFDGLHPRWAVIAIGTNNFSSTEHARSSTPPEITDAIAAICAEVHSHSPETHVIVMGIFPRGAQANDPLRAPIAQTNQLLAQKLAQTSFVTFLDIGKKFLASDGSLPTSVMPDGTHPSDAGYQIWADALKEAGLRP